MPYSITVDKTCNAVLITCIDTVSYEEINQHYHDILAHPDYQRGMDVLRDSRNATMLDFDYDNIRNYANFHDVTDKQMSPCKVATVFTDAASFGVGRQASSIHNKNGVERRPFFTWEEAIEWLGLPDDFGAA